MRKTILFIIIICSICLSCVPKVQYDSNYAHKKKGWVGEPESSIYMYPFNDESQNNTAEITIELNKTINPDSIKIEIPPLKYNKKWLCLYTQDDCEHAAYAYTWAGINGKPQTRKYFYDVQHLLAGDLPPDTFSYHKALGSTDGAGNEVRFAFTIAIYQENKDLNDNPWVCNDANVDGRFNMKSTLIWSDIKDMLNYGEGIAFHDADLSSENCNNEDSIIKHFYIGEDSVKKHLSGRCCKMLAEPDGNIHYTNAGIKFHDIQTLTAQADANTTIYPFKVNSDLLKAVISRTIYNGPSDIKTAIINNMSINNEDRPAISIGAHRTYNDTSDLFLWINNTYGKDGDDSVWFPSQEEYFEYCYYRNHAQITKNICGKTLKITVSMPSGSYFYYPGITINTSGVKKEDITSLSSSDNVTGLSYANNNGKLMININCRKHLLDLAKHYVSVYMADKTEDKLRDAKYFVDMLKPSTDKDALLNQIK